ncbi:choice-of-anchor I family protein [Kocuria rosea]|uniref:Alkaline phosphatase n=1 Tax=Kocuria rosea TaxID=1275 RepID=A0A4R5YLX9_KOCRO|nr:choice-of-anchor I family protein [Kocuria rosea]TDL46534.1 alkaline phosphatase [Kocuria rosea]
MTRQLTRTTSIAAAVCLLGGAAGAAHAQGGSLELTPVGSYSTGVFDASAAEIVAHHPATQRVFVVNADQAVIEVLDIAEASGPTKLFELTTTGVTADDGSTVPEGAVANSVAVREDGLVVVAVESDPKTDAGWLVLFDGNAEGSEPLGAVRVGAQPDMVALTPKGDRAIVANEGEPAEDYSTDPEGSVSILKLPKRLEAPSQHDVRTADFHAFEGENLPEGVRIYGGREDAGTGTPEFPVSENLEPEYVTVSENGSRAYITLQEANAIAELNVHSGKITDVVPAGTVDRTEVPMDASDKDGEIDITTHPVQGFRQPDAIASYRLRGTDYLVTANEGDSRDWEGYSEEARVKDLGQEGLPPICESVVEDLAAENGSPMTVEQLQAEENLGRLNITTAQGLVEDGSCYQSLYTYGSRGFSILTPDGEVVFDSGAQFEEITAERYPEVFNSNHTETNFEGRSDDKGPEPEGVVVGEVEGHTYAFISLERIGGVMVYDITDPENAEFTTYVNNRDFTVSVEGEIEEDPSALEGAGDLGPEGLAFISAEDSPEGVPLLVVGNEVSGTTTAYEITG